MSNDNKFIFRNTRTSDSLVVRLPEVVASRRTRKMTPATDKEALFEWAEDFVRRHDEDFEELAKR